MAGSSHDELKARVACSAMLESNGWKVDIRESTAKAVKYRRGEGEIIIVIHDGRGWFDPTSQAKGDVFSLARLLGAKDFPTAWLMVEKLVGFAPGKPAWQRRSRTRPAPDVSSRWSERALPVRNSPAWNYLTLVRAIPDRVVSLGYSAGKLREGSKGSIWAAHADRSGEVVGWEERGPDWRGFASGGAKALFYLGNVDATRLCFTEAAIDAMSLAAVENCRPDSLYASTGGGGAPATEKFIRSLASRPGVQVVSAFDGNDQGDAYAARLRDITAAEGVAYVRLWPDAVDWNEQIVELHKAGRGTLVDER